jgi:hypothetical protein
VAAFNLPYVVFPPSATERRSKRQNTPTGWWDVANLGPSDTTSQQSVHAARRPHADEPCP